MKIKTINLKLKPFFISQFIFIFIPQTEFYGSNKMSADVFQVVFNELVKILKRYEKRLVLKINNQNKYILYTAHKYNDKIDLYFGGVEIKKNYVSFHLFPVYMYPEILSNISPELKKRMQGKSCFNFKKADKDLFKQLKELTETGFKRFKEEKFV